MKKSLLIFCITIIISCVATACTIGNKSKESNIPIIKIARFIEDTTTTFESNEYKFYSLSIQDDIKPEINNIWVTSAFLENQTYKKRVKEYLEKGCNILVQQYKITSHDVCYIFDIPEEKRTTKSSVSEELENVGKESIRTAILIFKDNDLYYTPGANAIDFSLERLMVMFKFNKEMLGIKQISK